MFKKFKSFILAICIILVMGLLAAGPVFASTSSFTNFCLPAWQGNVTVATGYKSRTGSNSAYIDVTSNKYGGNLGDATMFLADHKTVDAYLKIKDELVEYAESLA